MALWLTWQLALVLPAAGLTIVAAGLLRHARAPRSRWPALVGVGLGLADTVLPRGLARFPKSAELLALKARELRSHGKVAESLEAMQGAMAADSTLGGEAHLMIAQAQLDLDTAIKKKPIVAVMKIKSSIGKSLS